MKICTTSPHNSQGMEVQRIYVLTIINIKYHVSVYTVFLDNYIVICF